MQKTIPVSAAPFFHEYTFSALDPDIHAPLAIERILAYGNRAELHWLFEYYGREKLRTWVEQDGARLLPKRRYRLWCVLFDITFNTDRPKTAWPY